MKIKLANKCQAIFEKNWIVKKGNLLINVKQFLKKIGS